MELKNYNKLNDIVKDYKEDKDLYQMIVNTVRFFDYGHIESRRAEGFNPASLIDVLKHFDVKLTKNNMYQMCAVADMIVLVTKLTGQDIERVKKVVWKAHYDGWYDMLTPMGVSWKYRVTGITQNNPKLK